MTFAENINRICLERGTSLTSLVKKVKGHSSFATAINRGSLPKESELIAFANELNCSVMDFFADEEDLTLRVVPQNEDEKDIIRVFRSLSRKNKHEFMAMVYDYEHAENLELYRVARSVVKSESDNTKEATKKTDRLKELPKVTDEKDL